MTKQYINPENLPNWQQAFSQIVVCNNPGSTVYISGQVAVDENKNLVGEGDLAKQAMKAFDNLHLALETVGAKETDVVKLTIYIKEYLPENSGAISAALQAYYFPEAMPASTWVGVQSLADPKFLIEVDAIAVIGE